MDELGGAWTRLEDRISFGIKIGIICCLITERLGGAWTRLDDRICFGIKNWHCLMLDD